MASTDISTVCCVRICGTHKHIVLVGFKRVLLNNCQLVWAEPCFATVYRKSQWACFFCFVFLNDKLRMQVLKIRKTWSIIVIIVACNWFINSKENLIYGMLAIQLHTTSVMPPSVIIYIFQSACTLPCALI